MNLTKPLRCTIAAAFISTLGSGCITKTIVVNRTIQAGPVKLADVAGDLGEIGHGLTTNAINTNMIGKALGKLSLDLPELGMNLQSLGQTPNRFGNRPLVLETDLKVLGDKLTSPKYGDSFKALGDELLKPKPDPNAINAAENSLANDLKNIGPPLASVGDDLSDSGKSVGFKTDFGQLKAPPETLAKHLKKLGNDLTGLPAGGAGDSLLLLGDEISAVANDLTPASSSLATNGPTLPYTFLISVGATFQSPYTVSYNPTAKTAVLTNTGNTTAGTLEISFFDRYVLRPHRAGLKSQYLDYDDTEWHWANKWQGSGWILRPDFEWHIGFLFASGTNPTNFPASTIAGGGDFYTDTSIGIPIARRVGPSLVQQLSLELSGGGSTDKHLMAVHPNFLVGPGYQAGFTAPGLLGTTNGPAFIIGKFGYGFVDVPDLISSKTGLDVRVEDLPKFKLKGAPAIAADFAYPLGNGSYFDLRLNAYFLDNPTPWNISAGLTIQFDSIGKLFGAGH